MKTLKQVCAVLMAGGLCLGAGNALANLEVSASVQVHATADFYEPLTPHGTWVEVGSYGRCWHPAHVEVGWRPYCEGEWVWTDCGWYWNSDEPWGWACYHYGTWVSDPAVGWVWVPGIEWAPAWVEWRVGGGYIGWAPLAPRGVVLAPAMFGFVEIGHFHERIRPTTLVINNTTIINRTTRISEASRETRTIDGKSQQVVVNHGPKVEDVQKATGQRMSAVPIREAALRTPAPKALSTPERGREPGNREAAPAEKPGAKSMNTPDQGREPGARDTKPSEKPARPESPATPDRGGKVDQGKGEPAAPRIAPHDNASPPAERPARPEAPPRGGSGRGQGDGREKDRGDEGGGGGGGGGGRGR